MKEKLKQIVARFNRQSKLSLFLFLTFLISGILCLGVPAAPVSAATLESLPIGTYINFGGKIWQKFDYYSGTNGMTLDSTAQTYLLQYNPNYQTAFDGKANSCYSNQGYGWNDFNSSQLKNYLNDTTENGFLGSLSNNSWVINKTDWSTTDQETGYVGNKPNNSNTSCTTTGGTGAITVSARVALPSYQEWTNKNVNIANTVNGMSYWWTRTPISSDTYGSYVRVVSSGGAFNNNYANNANGVRPALHLKSNIQVSTGDGTVVSPYCLSDGVTDSCTPTAETNPTDCSGANASKLACQVPGTYFNFGGKVWQKAKFYNSTIVDNTAQTYLIMSQVVNTGVFDNQQNLCASQPYGYNDFSSSNTIYNNLNTTFYNSLPTEKSWIESKTWSTTDDLLQNNKSKISGSPCTYQYDGTGATTVNTKIGLMSAAEWNNRYYKSGLALTNPSTTSWTRTPYSYGTNGYYVRVVSSGGAFYSYSAYYAGGVRPALHLASNIQVSGGAGTLGSPYCLTDGSIVSGDCNVAPTISLTSPAASTSLNSIGVFNLSGFVGDADIGQSLTVSATLNGITKTQVISGGVAAIVDEEFLLSWSAGELGDGFVLNGGSNPIVVTVIDDGATSKSATVNFTGNINVNFANAQNEQPLNTIPSGSIVYFGGRRFVKIANQVTGESYLWQASDEQQQPWHAVVSSYNNAVADFYTNPTKLGYWLTDTYASLLNVAQPSAESWMNNANWTMGNEAVEASVSVTGKISLPSYSEWATNKGNYCMAVYGVECNSNIYLPFAFWLRTTYGNSSNRLWSVLANTFVFGNSNGNFAIRPALNLTTGIQACGNGDGSFENPYFLGNGNCITTNQPLVPVAGKIESYSAGTVIQLDDYKFIKMADYLEPQRLNSSGTTSNSYFVMANDYTTSLWDQNYDTGCINGTCGGVGGWTDTNDINHVKNILNTNFYGSLSQGVKSIIADTTWPVGGVSYSGNSENNEFVRTDISKIALISSREWFQHGADYCKSSQNKATRNCNIDSFTPSWWSRVPDSEYSGDVWFVNKNGSLSSYGLSNYVIGVRPALNLKSNISPYCGSGTNTDPYLLTAEACNTPPVITLDNATLDQQLPVSGNITFTGSLADVDAGQQLNLKIQVMADDGVTPLYSKNYPIATLSPVNQSWSVSLNYLDLINLGERFDKVVFTLDDGIASSQVVYTGIITLESLQGKVDELYKLLGVDLAGQIYYPMNKKMDNVGDTYDGYTLLTNIDFSHQLWTQTLNSHPDMLSQINQDNEQATPSSQVNTYLVKFFQPVQNLGVMSLSP